MRALVWDGQTAEVKERAEPVSATGTAVVRMRRAGVCNTDLEIVKGYMDFRGVLGHELAGEVVMGPPALVKKRVACEINFACGVCEACARGLQRHCPTRAVMGILRADGAFAERVAVPIVNLHPIPDNVSDDQAVFIEPLAAAYEITEQVHVDPSMSCLVLGDGKLGLLAAQVLASVGARVTAVGKYPDKLAILAKRGIETKLASDKSPGLFDLVVEATGSSKGLSMAIAATRPRGTLVLKSTVASSSKLHLAPIVIHEIRIVGSRCGPFGPAIRALAEGRIDVASLVTATYPLHRAAEALRRAAEPGVMKVIVENSRVA